MSYILRCSNCNQIEKNSIINCGKCDGSLIPEYKYPKFFDLKILKNDNSNSSVYSTFSSLLPICNDPNFVRFQDYFTPIIRCQELSKKYKTNLSAKLEFLNLTASVKEREGIIEASMAKKLGYAGIIVASTGNLAASLAFHCQQAKLKCLVYVPRKTSDTKLMQIKTYGAKVKKLKMNYDQIAKFVKQEAQKKNYFLGALQAFRMEGYKTVAYELFFQTKRLPDQVIVPMGDATTFAGIWRGFLDLKKLGLIKKLPRMIGVQEKGIDPIVIAYNNQGKLEKNFHGLAKAIHISQPLDIKIALYAIKTTGGVCLSVTSSEIKEAFQELARNEGIYSEYASATTLAAFKKLEKEKLSVCDTILIITGHGLKN